MAIPVSPEQVELCWSKGAGAAPGCLGTAPFDDHVFEAVATTICFSLIEIEDDLERHLSGTHAEILNEVRRCAPRGRRGAGGKG